METPGAQPGGGSRPAWRREPASRARMPCCTVSERRPPGGAAALWGLKGMSGAPPPPPPTTPHPIPDTPLSGSWAGGSQGTPGSTALHPCLGLRVPFPHPTPGGSSSQRLLEEQPDRVGALGLASPAGSLLKIPVSRQSLRLLASFPTTVSFLKTRLQRGVSVNF